MPTRSAEIPRGLVGNDLVDVLHSQHRMLEHLLGRLSRMREGVDAVASAAHLLVGTVTALTVRGFVAEETHLHPLLLDFLDDGPELVERNLAEHDAAERTMERLVLLRPSDPGFWCAVNRLCAILGAHVDGANPHRFADLRGLATAPADVCRLWADTADVSQDPGPLFAAFLGDSDAVVTLCRPRPHSDACDGAAEISAARVRT